VLASTATCQQKHCIVLFGGARLRSPTVRPSERYTAVILPVLFADATGLGIDPVRVALPAHTYHGSGLLWSVRLTGDRAMPCASWGCVFSPGGPAEGGPRRECFAATYRRTLAWQHRGR